MDNTTVITIYYYGGRFYLPTTVRSLSGMVGVTEPVVVVPAGDRAVLIEQIELHTAEGNAVLSNAEFRTTTDTVVIAAMRLPNRLAFYTQTRRWAIVEEGGAYTLYPYKPAATRGVTRDDAHAVTLNPASFAADAVERIGGEV